jgi:hypothetical protein
MVVLLALVQILLSVVMRKMKLVNAGMSILILYSSIHAPHHDSKKTKNYLDTNSSVNDLSCVNYL